MIRVYAARVTTTVVRFEALLDWPNKCFIDDLVRISLPPSAVRNAPDRDSAIALRETTSEDPASRLGVILNASEDP